MMKKRELGFDLLKLFAIYLVIWGHCTQYFFSSDKLEEPIFRIIYSFHMPLFIMISGYFSTSSLKKNIPDLFSQKFIQLIVPCVTWGTLLFLRKIILEFDSVDISFQLWTHYSLRILWFLKCLFICYIIYYFSFKYITNKFFSIVVFILIGMNTPFYQVNVLYPYFLIGVIMHMYQGYIDQYKKYIGLTSMISFLFLHFVMLYLNIQSVYLDNSWISNVTALMGCFCFIYLFRLIKGESRFLKILSGYGQCTLGVYILQTFILELILSRLIQLDDLNFFVSNLLINPILSGVILFVCVLLTKVLCRSRYIDLIFMGNLNFRYAIASHKTKMTPHK